uniref:Uncharacterized protein n=1 Tax=uncultured marine group II/III euryarchaeote KM3_155_G07 TaxID=1457898 RepID=A0A075GEU4_9EURY|nr:hypothetical protein [uncultured marine group II/III euryarchaeote KM3_155_G07]
MASWLPSLDFVWPTPFGDFQFTFPPADPWMGYLLVIYFLIIIRLLLLIGPYDALLRRFGGKARSWLKRIRAVRKATGLKGLYKLVIREVIILLLPISLALSIRIFFGHPGRIPWTSKTLFFFGFFALFWIGAELTRIWKTRRSVLSIAEISSFSSWKAGAALDTLGLTSTALDSLSKLGEDSTPEDEEEKPGAVRGYLRALSVRVGSAASFGKGKIDQNVQDRFDKSTKTQWKLLMTDIILSVFPLAVVYLLSWILT